jgi:hypothetical protein
VGVQGEGCAACWEGVPSQTGGEEYTTGLYCYGECGEYSHFIQINIEGEKTYSELVNGNYTNNSLTFTSTWGYLIPVSSETFLVFKN